MGEERVKGTLHLVRQPGAPPLSEEVLSFTSLQELLDLCTRHAAGAAFVRVELRGQSGGLPRRLVLDFGQFSAWPE